MLRKLDVAGAAALSAAMLYAFTNSSAGAEGRRAPDEPLLDRGRAVYAVNCAMCHGAAGDGNGPAARMFVVRPRDFRRGLFKFRSTPSGSLPTADDLLGTVTRGLRWTAMVGRADLSVADRRAVVRYVEAFSARFASEARASTIDVAPGPPRTPQLVERGRNLFRDAGCATCHGERGLGDGPAALREKDDWGWPTRPSDLTWRPLKRGSADEATYLTLATGLSGTPMPSYADAMSGEQLWALVAYLDTLVPPARRLDPRLALGEEGRGWMALRMGMMMGGGMMGPGMMGRGAMRRAPPWSPFR